MDGLLDLLPPVMAPSSLRCRQRTLKAAIGCVGVGVHSGRRVTMTLRPAPSRHGIVFRRTDLGVDIPARFDRVVGYPALHRPRPGRPTRGSARSSTSWRRSPAAAIDNALVELDGPELPILDGSAAPFVFLLDCAGHRRAGRAALG